MNQLEGTGPPPAPKEKIDSLPTIVVTEEHVGTLPMASLICYFVDITGFVVIAMYPQGLPE